MAENDLKEHPIPMELLNSIDSDYAPSADGLAWADSCLTKFTEVSDSDLSSFKESLFEILNGSTQPASLMVVDSGSHVDVRDNRTFPSSESIVTAFSMLTDNHFDFTDEGDEFVQTGKDGSVDDVIHKNKMERLKGKIVLEENALLLDHAEFVKVESSDLGFNFGSSEFEDETPSPYNIFQVWDLDVSNEQDEFSKELNNALEESSSQAIASTAGITQGWQHLAVEPLDGLVSGISELSLG